MKQPDHEISDIFNRYWADYTTNHKVSIEQKKAVRAIQVCRTSAAGYHLVSCSNSACDYEHSEYDSCRNRHCPKCQWSKQVEWVQKRLDDLLPVPYFHHVFTLPHLLNSLAMYNKALIYDLFFKACAYTLHAFSKDPKFLGAKLAFTAILHTWGQTLCYHIHLHFIITGGGLSEDETQFKRLPYQKTFLFPSKAMSKTLRGKFVELLKKAYYEGKLHFPSQLAHIEKKSAFLGFCREVGNDAWYNYTKAPFSSPENVIKYIGNYTHRVAIANHRLLDIDGGQVRFKYKDYRDESQTKPMDLPAEHFIQRFLWHILPSGFKRIRHYGFLASGCRKQKLELARTLLNVLSENAITALKGVKDWMEKIDVYLERVCPQCKKGQLVYEKVAVWNSS